MNKTVSFTDRYGHTDVTIESAGVTDSIFKDLYGKPIKSESGEFVFVTFSKFTSPLAPDDLLEVKGSDGKLYGSALADDPGTAAYAGDPNHFTEAFDLPKNAAKGAVLIVHEDGTDRGGAYERYGRTPPPGYEDGAHEVDLNL